MKLVARNYTLVLKISQFLQVFALKFIIPANTHSKDIWLFSWVQGQQHNFFEEDISFKNWTCNNRI